MAAVTNARDPCSPLFYRTQGLRWRGKRRVPRHAHPMVRDQDEAVAVLREAGWAVR